MFEGTEQILRYNSGPRTGTVCYSTLLAVCVCVSECVQRALAIGIRGDGSHHPTYLRITFVIYSLLPLATICK